MPTPNTGSESAPEKNFFSARRTDAISHLVHEINNILGDIFMDLEDLQDLELTDEAMKLAVHAQGTMDGLSNFLKSIGYIFSPGQKRTPEMHLASALKNLSEVIQPLLKKKKSSLQFNSIENLNLTFSPGIFCEILFDLLLANNDHADFKIEISSIEHEASSANSYKMALQLLPSSKLAENEQPELKWTNTEAYLGCFPKSQLENPTQLTCVFQGQIIDLEI